MKSIYVIDVSVLEGEKYIMSNHAKRKLCKHGLILATMAFVLSIFNVQHLEETDVNQ